jgi:methyl-accepting chemotaxis protein
VGKRFISLRIKLSVAFAVLMAANGIFAFVYFPWRSDVSARQSAHARATDLALVLADAVRPGLEFEDPDSAAKVLEGLEAAAGAIYAAVYRRDGRRYADWNGAQAPETAADPGDAPRLEERGGQVHVTVRISAKKAGAQGLLAMGFSLDRLEMERRANRWTVGLVALLLTLIGMGMGWVVGTVLVKPVATLTELTSRIVETGELGAALSIESNDEVGLLSRSFGKMVEWLRGVVTSLNALTESLARVIERLSQAGATVTNGANVIREHMRESTTAIAELRRSLEGLAENVDALQKNAVQGASSIVEMATVNDEVAKKTQSMTESVDQTAKTVERITEAFAGTARNIEELNQTLLETASAMTEIDMSISEVGQRAGETAHLSETVSGNAGKGVEVLERTVDGIQNIQDSSQLAAGVISRLGESVSKIGTILSVIDEVTQQTNLLALNAAIIAAQAGEAGTGFGVVADEIKVLATRTGESTTEINTLIQTIRDESTQAQMAMEDGTRNVREGVALGEAARVALSTIAESADRARTMVRAIAQATEEQVRGTRHVASAIQRISQTVQQLSAASSEQAKRSSEVMENTNHARLLTQQVDRSSREQAIGSKQVIGAIESIRQTVEQVAGAQRAQSQAAQKVLGAVEAIQQVVGSQGKAVSDLESTIATLRAQADKLASEVSRFRA